MKVRFLALVFAIVSCAGCGGSVNVSSIGLYGDAPGPQAVKGSNAQGMVTRSLPFTFDEVMDAAETALFRRGINIEENDRAKGRMTASSSPGIFPLIHPGFVSTMAIYVKQTSPKPLTQITIVLDRHTMMGWGGFEGAAASELIGDIQKVLSTYQ